MTEKDTYTLIRALGTVRTQYGTHSIEAWDVISNTAKDQAAIDLEEYSRNDLTAKIEEAANREGATVVSIEWVIDPNYGDPSDEDRES